MNNIEDNQLHHSHKAINILHEFHNKKFMLYVEGDDDIVFWDENFREYMPSDFYQIEPVHGKENLDTYITGINEGVLKNVVVACDSDFTDFTEANLLDNLFIVRTYGHSIENTMFCPYSVATYIRRLSKTSLDYFPEVIGWLNLFCSTAKKLLPYEIENEINPTHCTKLPKIFNNGFTYYQSSQAKTDLDEEKVNAYIQSITSDFDPNRISEIEQKINNDQRETRYLIQGHFIADAIMNYIRMRVKQIKGRTVSLSNDAIYASIMDCKNPCDSSCNDKMHLKTQISKIHDYYKHH